MGNRIRLSESMLRSIIRESVIKALNEEEEKSEIRRLMDKMHGTNDVRKVLQYAKELEKLVRRLAEEGKIDAYDYEIKKGSGDIITDTYGTAINRKNGFGEQLADIASEN